jgi:hypothetical protein
MIADSLHATKLALSNLPLTIFAASLYILTGGIYGFERELGPDIVAGLSVPILLAIFFVTYSMSRRAGAPTADEIGSIGGWFFWGILGAVPLIVVAVAYVFAMGFEAWSNSETPILPELILYVVGTILAMPLLAVSTGRAISSEGPDASEIFAYCKRNAVQIVFAGCALLFPSNLIADGALIIFGSDAHSLPMSALFGVLGGLALLATSVLTIGISAAIYRNAEEGHVSNENPTS